MIQRFTECCEYKIVLDKCYKCPDQWLRLIYATSFVYMSYSNTYSRTKKPFNPLLYETFEYIKDDLHYISEQVSHHPPISASLGETPNYKFWGTDFFMLKIIRRHKAEIKAILFWYGSQT